MHPLTSWSQGRPRGSSRVGSTGAAAPGPSKGAWLDQGSTSPVVLFFLGFGSTSSRGNREIPNTMDPNQSSFQEALIGLSVLFSKGGLNWTNMLVWSPFKGDGCGIPSRGQQFLADQEFKADL